MSEQVAKDIRILFTDIDDTLTTQGKLSAEVYEALWRLHCAGIAVVPVTGRPAGWCDLIARQWPVAGVVGENGALCFFEKDGKLNRLYHSHAEQGDRLNKIREVVLREVQGSRVSKDQFARLFDLAIDFCEEPPDLGREAAQKIASIFSKMGANAKISSIHVNGWFGDYDKLAMVQAFVESRWGLNFHESESEFFFCGDSPNDEPMFAAFTHSCGVANIRDFWNELNHYPSFVADKRGGAGFCELVDTILGLRG